MDTRLVAEAGGSTALADAVASVARLVGQLAGVVSRSPAAPSSTDHVADADPLRQLSESCLEGLAALARVEAATAAAKVRLVATYAEAATIIEGPAVSAHEASAREMTVVAEVACVLTIGERAASALLGEAHALTTSLPAALDALQTGSISWQHARVLAEEITGLSPTDASALEAHFFDPHAPNPARGAAPGELVPSRFRRKVRSWRERNYPDTLEKRHAVSVADRRMEYRPDADGMAWISLYLPGDAACAVWNKATAMARGLQGPEEPRTLSQIRADMAAGLLLGHTGQHLQKLPVPKADVLVTVPVFSLLGLTEEPAELDGYGPIPASMARRLVADGAGSFYRVLVDPRDGAPLEIGRENYRLPESMKRWLRMRDGKCTFPGCSNHTLDNEVDHLTAWQQGGTTGISNLGQACPRHHRLKHRSAWTPTEAAKNEPPGWRSPTGRYYPAEQADWVPPVIPQECLPGPPKFSTGLATFSTGPPTFSSGPPTFSPETASPFEQALLAHVAA